MLAESIVADRLNPMDRWLVLKSSTELGKYIVLEGNRRLAAIRLLNSRHLLDSLEVRSPVKKRFLELHEQFDLDTVQPIACFEIGDRPTAAAWLSQRHTGENKGRGIVNWGGVATARFRGRDPALQALDFVLEHGELAEEEKGLVEDYFPISTLDRLLSTPAVRNLIAVDVSESKLRTDLPAPEILKPLRRMILDLATGEVNVSMLKSREQMVAYTSNLGKDLPNMKKRTGAMKSVDDLGERDFTPPPKPKAKRKPKPLPVRKTLIPRDCYLTVSNAKIAEITKELRELELAHFPHSISVLFRVFLEQSVDHHLATEGISLKSKTRGGMKDKNLRTKVGEAINAMIASGVVKRDLAGIERGIDDKNNPLFIDTLHNYIHNRFYSPTERDLKVSWDNAQFFFERIWG